MPRRILVAVSGGADSMALVHALNEIKNALGLELILGHIHHGKTTDQELNHFRDHAQSFVLAYAHQNKLRAVTNSAEETNLNSEADLREYRYGFLTKWQKERDCEAIALAHHFEDLLETQMMRLFRGSSRLGLSAMSLLSPQQRLRPFLNFEKKELLEYLQTVDQTWVEDPSNLWEKPLRNQVREWLNEIEQKLPGAKRNLSKSLQRLARMDQEGKSPWKNDALTKGGIRRGVYLSLSEPYKAELLAHYVRENGLKNYTSGQIHELMKRLDVPKKEDTFKFLGCSWSLKAETIEIID